MMTRREALIGGGASLLSSAAGFVFGNGSDVVRPTQESEWVDGEVPDLPGIERVRYRTQQRSDSGSVKYQLRLNVDEESDLRKIDFFYESPTGTGSVVHRVKHSDWEVTMSAVNAPIFSLLGYDDPEKNSIDWMWDVDVWFLCGDGSCTLAWKGGIKESAKEDNERQS